MKPKPNQGSLFATEDHTAWVRTQVTERKLTGVTDEQIGQFLRRFPDPKVALKALDSVWHGRHFRDE